MWIGAGCWWSTPRPVVDLTCGTRGGGTPRWVMEIGGSDALDLRASGPGAAFRWAAAGRPRRDRGGLGPIGSALS